MSTVVMAAEGFAAIPNWMIRDESISLYAITVYAALASHSGPGGIHPGQETLASEARCSDRQVRRALAELEALGVVERVRRKSSQGRASNGYLLHPNGAMAVDEVPDQVEDPQSATAEVKDWGDGGSGLGASVVPITEEEPIKEEEEVAPVVVELCALLADLVRANGYRVETVGATWWRACDRLMRIDKLTAAQIEILIRWATADEFWAVNIRSMPTLRKHAETIRGQRNRQLQGRGKRSTVEHGRGVDQILRDRANATEKQAVSA